MSRESRLSNRARVWGPLPSSLSSRYKRGARLVVTAAELRRAGLRFLAMTPPAEKAPRRRDFLLSWGHGGARRFRGRNYHSGAGPWPGGAQSGGAVQVGACAERRSAGKGMAAPFETRTWDDPRTPRGQNQDAAPDAPLI